MFISILTVPLHMLRQCIASIDHDVGTCKCQRQLESFVVGYIPVIYDEASLARNTYACSIESAFARGGVVGI